jgi:hypothetical protein
MVVFRRVIGVPLNTMIIQITGKGKDKKGRWGEDILQVVTKNSNCCQESSIVFSGKK